jgi:hypothetical protein
VGGATVTYSNQDESAALADEAALPVHNPGWLALVVGVLTLVAGGLYLQWRHKRGVAISVIVMCTITSVTFLGEMVNIRDMFGNSPSWAAGDYSPGFGLLAALVLSLILLGLAITAYVFERSAR